MSVKEWNLEYAPVWDLAQSTYLELANMNYACDMEFSIFNTVKEDGVWVEERFPIPVLTINETYKILFHPTHVSLTLTMPKETASRFRYQSFLPKMFDIHGMEDMNCVFYESGDAFNEVAKKIAESDEEVIGITFSLPLLNQTIADVAELLAFASHE